MSKGFYHPAVGCWQTTTDNPDTGAYPAGTVEVPIKPGPNMEWDAGTGQWVAVPPPPTPVPAEVTMRQARLALLAIGKLDDVDAALASIHDAARRKAAQIEWEYSSAVKRDSALVQQLAPALGLDAAGLDALFVQAAAI